MKQIICTYAGVIGGMIASALGGWDGALATLLGFMAVDYVTGLLVAGVFHRSDKSDSGALRGCPFSGTV